MQRICILGSTGSIGSSSLDVIRRHPQEYVVDVLTANNNLEKMLQQCVEFKPKLAVMLDSGAAEKLAEKLRKKNIATTVKSGADALLEAVEYKNLNCVITAIVGGAGLLPALTAVKKGLRVLLANKEALVMSGELFMQAVETSGALLLPVDSEHNAIFQCLPVCSRGKVNIEGLSKILLTGSGGPFRQLPIEQLPGVTPKQACAHPNWDMGKKISVDSATMMNKGLELIEACFLFGLNLQQIDIVLHAQSIVHSMVAFKDGSVLAQMGNPDMRTPIAHCLGWPNRIDSGVKPLDFFAMGELTFEKPDEQRFPCLSLAAEAMRRGGTAPCILNAANEVAVNAFLQGKIVFTDIAEIIRKTLSSLTSAPALSIENILVMDAQARQMASALLPENSSSKN